MPTARRSAKALRILACYAHEPLWIVLDGEAQGIVASPETHTWLARIASNRLLAIMAAGPEVLASAKVARRWVREQSSNPYKKA